MERLSSGLSACVCQQCTVVILHTKKPGVNLHSFYHDDDINTQYWCSGFLEATLFLGQAFC